MRGERTLCLIVFWMCCISSVFSACSQATCVLLPESVQGPFYAPSMLVRQNITEASAGIPLTLNIKVIDINNCQAIVGAAVDIWHCDSLGVYSAFSSEGTAGETFLRGIQFTENDGTATFSTIYPGFYSGRTTHIHIKVHINSTIDDISGTIIGGHVSHTGQLYFNDTTDTEIGFLWPYNERGSVRRTNQTSDGIFNSDNGEMALLDLQLADPINGYAGGIIGSIIVGVDSLDGQSAPTSAPSGTMPVSSSPNASPNSAPGSNITPNNNPSAPTKISDSLRLLDSVSLMASLIIVATLI